METTESRVSRVELNLAEFRTEVRQEFAAVRAEIREVKERLDAVQVTLSKEIQENRRLTLVLHEELIARLKLLGEASPPAKS